MIYDLNKSSKSSKLLFISTNKNLNGTILSTRVPTNFLTKNNYEDNKIKRVCFSTSIDGCLRALSMNLTNKEFAVYEPIGKYKVITPTIKQVPDSKLTKEKWICKPVKIRKIGIIKVIKDKGEPGLRYKYGNNEAELYDWDWEWIERS